MSLIYQSLQKLQPGEQGHGSAPGHPGPPDGNFRLRSLVRILLGIALLGAAVYGIWIIAGSDAPHSAEKSGGNSVLHPESVPADNASQRESATVKPAGKQYGTANHTGQSATNETGVSADKKDPALLRLSCRRNGTRARLSLEFDREPASPERSWNNQTRTLDVSFPHATAEDPQSRLKNNALKGLNISLPSSDPLRLRLKVPELKSHHSFILRESADYGPRYVLALRFAPEKEQGDEPSGRAKASRAETPDTPKNSARSKQDKDNIAEAEENPEPESGKKSKSGSMEVASSTPEDQSPEGQGSGSSREKRLQEQKQNKGAENDLRRRLQSDPENIDLRTRHAEELISEKRYRRALQVLQLDNTPNVQDNIKYYALAAYASRKLGRNQRAARIYQILARNEPRQGRWWMGLGLCLERLDRNESARRAYERALESSGLDGEVRDFLRQRKKRLDQGQNEE